MTDADFKSQITRLQSRFGERAFDAEFTLLIWKDVHDMRFNDFRQVVDTFIGSRPHHKPPLQSEFREHRLLIERHRMEGEKRGPAKILNHPSMRPLADILRKDFGAVDSVKDAFEIARLKLLRGDKDPA